MNLRKMMKLGLIPSKSDSGGISQHKAPMVLELIVKINQYLSANELTREDFRVLLNKHLSELRKIKEGHSGLMKLNRWLDPTGDHWCEPLGEIALAMKRFVDEIR